MIDETKFHAVLDLNDESFAEKFQEALGLMPGESVNIITPQFDRVDGKTITYLPKTVEEYSVLPFFSKESLLKLGCQIWDNENGRLHWLYPSEWYDSIPNGLEVTDICGKTEKFVKGETDDDKRFGALSFGFFQVGGE